jgi:A/G-specific adenine glycosylase
MYTIYKIILVFYLIQFRLRDPVGFVTLPIMKPVLSIPAPSEGTADALLKWFDANKRDLPFRKPAKTTRADPYHVWISEIMAQQTQIDTLVPYYNRFVEKFPTLDALAEASEQDVLKAWEGLGYYARARNLRKAAVEIKNLGEFPRTPEALSKLPGIGPYTAGAVASLAFNEKATAVDGNVMRVAARLMDSPADTALPATRNLISNWLLTWMPENRPGDFNEALMELGALVCTPKSPSCLICPWCSCCLALARGTIAKRPVKSKKIKHRQQKIAAALVKDPDGRLLILKRPDKGLLAGLWGLPAVAYTNKPAGLSQLTALISEKLGLAVPKPVFVKNDRHVFTHITWQIAVYRWDLDVSASPKDPNWLFASADALNQAYPLPTAFSKLLK